MLLHNGRHFDASVIPPEEWLHNGRHFDASVILPDEWRAYVASRTGALKSSQSLYIIVLS